LSYLQRRELLTDLDLAYEHVQTPPHWADVEATTCSQSPASTARMASSRSAPPRCSGQEPAHGTGLNCRSVEPGEGRRTGWIGALLVGAHDDAGQLVYLGHVGTGFTEAALRRLHGQLAELERATSPFAVPVPREHARGGHWVEPLLVGDVEYREFTAGERRLRHSAWNGLRVDIRAPAHRTAAAVAAYRSYLGAFTGNVGYQNLRSRDVVAAGVG
jgi:bifunctional non-homologous end joining protein LigD